MVLRRLVASFIVEILILNAGFAGEIRTYGSISGTVFAQQTKQPIPSANVILVGSSLGASTDESGQFTIAKVPNGTYHIQVSILGYRRAEDSVTVRGGIEVVGREYPLVEEQIKLGGVQAQIERFSRVSDSPVSSLTFSTSELKNTAGSFDDVMRAIRLLPGVAQAKADRTDIMVRGGASSENLYLIDNIEVPYINHFSTQGSGGGSVSIIDMDEISTSSFSTGGFGVRFGDKLSSVLDIKLREGSTEAVHGKATISTSQLGLKAEGPLAGNGSYLFSVRKSFLDYAFRMYGFGFAPEFWDYTGKATYSIGSNDKVTLLAIGATDRIKYFNATADQRYENSRLLFSNQDHYVAGATLRHLFSNGYATLTVRHAHSAFEYLQFSPYLDPLFQSSSVENETSVRADVVMQFSARTELTVGGEVRSDDVQNVINLKSTPKISLSQSIHETPGKAAVYAQLSNVIDNLKLTFGIRGSYFGSAEPKLAVAPRISSTLALSPVTSLTLSIGRYYQAPSYLWLAANPFNQNLSCIGVNQLVVGLGHLASSDLEFNIEGYVKQYFNYPTSLNHPSLIMANTGSGVGGAGEDYASFGIDSLVSKGRGLSKGIEISMQKKLSDVPCYAMVSICYSETQFTALDGVSRPSDYDQRIIVNAGGGYMLGDSWEVSGRFRLYTGRPYTPIDPKGTRVISEINGARVGINHQLDVRVARRWSIGPVVVETYLDVQNVYNRKPVDAPIFSEIRRQVEQVPSLGIVPTAGFAIQF